MAHTASLCTALLLFAAAARDASHGAVRALAEPPPRDTLRIGALLPTGGAPGEALDALRRGMTLGAEESVRTAGLIGLAVEVLSEHAGSPAEIVHAGERLLARGVSALVGGVTGEECRALAALAVQRRVPFLALRCAADNSRGDRCERGVFHVHPAAATLQRAREVYARRADTEATREVRVRVWHHTLGRYGAQQLNERFRRRFGAEMDDAAWGAWMAVKLITEAALRARSTASADLARHLSRAEARFDGHKGEPLTFDARTGELRQPLYVLGDSGADEARGHVVAEVSADVVFGPAGRTRRGSSTCDGVGRSRPK